MDFTAITPCMHMVVYYFFKLLFFPIIMLSHSITTIKIYPILHFNVQIFNFMLSFEFMVFPSRTEILEGQ